MNAHTNAVSDSGFAAQAVAAQTVRSTRPFYWSLRRELWESWWLWAAPLAAAALDVLIILLTAFRFNAERGRSLLSAPDAIQQLKFIQQQCSITGLLIMGITFLLAIFYCVDAFYNERRDRSIFFWKSLPVSDTVTVLAKVSIPLVILPIITFVIAAVTQWLVLAIDAAALAAHGRSLAVIGQVPIVQIQIGLLYHLVAVHSLWYAPIFGWLMLVSAWARRVPLLWGFLPPIVLAIIEKIAFNTEYFGSYLGYRISQGPSGTMDNHMNMAAPLAGITPERFITSPGLWGGLFVAGLFLAGAVQLRRYRAPS